METDTVDKIMIAVMVAVAIFLGNRIYADINSSLIKKEESQKQEENKREWCLEKIIRSGDSFGEGSAGQYEYQLITTTHGIYVYKKCNQ